MSNNNSNSNSQRQNQKQKEIVKQDEKAIKSLEKQIDEIWTARNDARDKGDMDTFREKTDEANPLQLKLNEMRRVALEHVNGKALTKDINER